MDGEFPLLPGFPGAAHPLPPEHSIGPSEAGAVGPAVPAVPEAQEESSSEYDTGHIWRVLMSRIRWFSWMIFEGVRKPLFRKPPYMYCTMYIDSSSSSTVHGEPRRAVLLTIQLDLL